jgi:hypothetical protein
MYQNLSMVEVDLSGVACATLQHVPAKSRLLQDLGVLAFTLPQVEILIPTRKLAARHSRRSSNGRTKCCTSVDCGLRMSIVVSSAIEQCSRCRPSHHPRRTTPLPPTP